ncbi:hypothetical protein [Gracilibacillus xinjiangensis]|uniref:Uncharacterized protein n=1 Tax=Gracilibacillus xinjiangensis TaxID=1193282 RepID=A0ABV8WYB7_9BACI
MTRILILFVLLLILPASHIEATVTKEGLPASAKASGTGNIVTGPDPYNLDLSNPMQGEISIRTLNHGDRWSALMNKDEMLIESSISTSDGDYHIIIQEPMLHHPNGVDPTWSGVVYSNQPMHGDTDTGIAELPKVEPAIAVWGWADVYKDGKLVQTNVPSHVMVVEKGDWKGITLAIHTEDKRLTSNTDGYILANWPEIEQLYLPKEQKQKREWIGWGALLFLTVWFGWLAISEPHNRRSKKA